MVIVLDSNNVVRLTGGALTQQQVAAQMSGWCAEYQLTGYSIQTVDTLPDGFTPGNWTYTAGSWAKVSDPVKTVVNDSSSLLKFLNPDLSLDRVATYLQGAIDLTDLMSTVNYGLTPDAGQPGCVVTTKDLIYGMSEQVVWQAGEIGKQATQIELLNDRISLKLNSNGHIAGMAIGWDESGDVSETIFITDNFKIALPDGTSIKQVFSVGSSNGVPTIGISGDLIVSGEITGRTLQTGLAGERFVVSADSNAALFYDADEVEKIWMGTVTKFGFNSYGVFGDDSVDESKIGLIGITCTGEAGLYGVSVSTSGVIGWSYGGYGASFMQGQFVGSVWSDSGKAPLHLGLSTSAAAPTHAALGGSIWPTAAGVLYINITPRDQGEGTSWQKVGSQ